MVGGGGGIDMPEEACKNANASERAAPGRREAKVWSRLILPDFLVVYGILIYLIRSFPFLTC